MNAEITDASVAPIQWYARSAVDDFLVAAAEKRSELEQQIADAGVRIERAHAAAGLHRLMAAMVLETQREVAEIRRAAELRALEIVTAAQRDAVPPTTTDADAVANDDLVIDLAAASRDAAAADASSVPPPRLRVGAGDDGSADDQFFAFLRDGLDGEDPLGPRAEEQEHA